MFATMAASPTPPVTLVRGTEITCPGCEAKGDRLYHFRPLDQNERYEAQLVVIYQHRRDRGGCGHLFAPLALSRAGEPTLLREEVHVA